MECNVYGINLNRIGSIFTWVSMLWTEGYNTLGTFQLELQQTPGALELFQPDRYCGIPESETLMLIKAVQVRNGSVIITGSPATCVLSDRVSTTVISNELAELALRGLVQSMDPWPCVELGKLQGLTDVFLPQKSDATILAYCEQIAQACDMGFRMRHDKAAKKLLFECYKPAENPNARYSSDYGNAGDLQYGWSAANYKNVAVVAGAGEGDARVTVYAGATASAGEQRREMYVDARQEQPEEGETDAEYQARLVAFGEEKLIAKTEIETLKFTIDDERAKLGDIVFCRFPEIGIQAKVRVVGLSRKSQNNGTSVTASLGTPIIIRRY